MPVSNRSGPAGSEIIPFSPEPGRRRHGGRGVFLVFAGLQDLFLQPTAHRLLAGLPQNCCVTGGPFEGAGFSRPRGGDWFVLTSCSRRPPVCMSSCNYTQYEGMSETVATTRSPF